MVGRMKQRRRVLVKAVDVRNTTYADLVSILLSSELRDSLSVEDREAWCTRGEVLDTPGGRLLFEWMERMGILAV